MIVMILSKASESLKGEISRWLIEADNGIFFGDISRAVKDELLKRIKNKIDKDKTGIIIIESNTTKEQGYTLETYGNTKRQIRDFDGINIYE